MDNIPENNENLTDEQKSTLSKKAKEKSTVKKFKIAYAFAVVIAVCGALAAKYSAEKSLGNINAPLENSYTFNMSIKSTEPTEEFSQPEEKEVRRNVTDVPDTRLFAEEPSDSNAAADKPATDTSGSSLPAETEPSPFAKPYGGYYSLPAGTDICRDYAESELIFSKTMGDWRTHPGVDFATDEGAQIKAISYGSVLSVKNDLLYGCTVEIDHGNGVTAKYCGFNAETLTVKKGDTVKSGALIGYLGTVPCEALDGAHLHFEILYNGKNVEPLELMGK